MIFYPTTYVYLLSGVPLNNTYTDTMTFSNEQAQIDYFMSKAVRSYTDFSYQRYNPARGPIAAIRIAEVADNLYNVNYLMFRNVNFSTKWFYAFVREINFINAGMTEIVYEIDIMQTWLFDIQYKTCFVVREHTNNDRIGSNLVPEELELGEYVIEDITPSGYMNPEQAQIGVAATFDRDMNDVTGGMYGNVYQGCTIMQFPTAQLFNQFWEQAIAANKAPDGVVNIFMIPQFIAQKDTAEPIAIVPFTYPKHLSNIDGYIPKNKKLFTYPYNFLHITNGQGNHFDAPFEFFDDDTCRFFIRGFLSPDISAVLVPANFRKGVQSDLVSNYLQRMTISGFPQCSANVDTYKMYLAQNASQMPINDMTNTFKMYTGVAQGAISTIGGVAQIAATLPMNALSPATWGMMGSGVSGAISGVNQIYDAWANAKLYNAKKQDIDSQAPQLTGSSSPTADFCLGYTDFTFSTMHIRSEFARIIDEYFSMFGYQTNRVKKPNITGRQSWNYVKTSNCNFAGNIPVDDLASIRKIFDNGITFWHTQNVGDYTQSNGIV